MRDYRFNGRVLVLAALLCAGLAGAPALAAPEPSEAGTVKTVKGAVYAERAQSRVALAPGAKVYAADRLVTGADGAVGITLRDSTMLSAGPNSTIALDAFAFNPTTHAGAIDATVKRGTLSVVSGKISKTSPESVRFRTPSTTLGVRGTEFVIDVAEQ